MAIGGPNEIMIENEDTETDQTPINKKIEQLGEINNENNEWQGAPVQDPLKDSKEAMLEEQRRTHASNFDPELHAAVAETQSSKNEKLILGDETTDNEEHKPSVKFPPLQIKQGALGAMSRTLQKGEEDKKSLLFGQKGGRESHQDIMSQQQQNAMQASRDTGLKYLTLAEQERPKQENRRAH